LTLLWGYVSRLLPYGMLRRKLRRWG